MNSLLAGSVYCANDVKDVQLLYRGLKIFPTPFKGIYYVPYETERRGWYITDPHLIIFKAAAIYLKTTDYYFGLYSALYYMRIIWNAFGSDIINPKISRKISRKLPSEKYWRGRVVNKIMRGYPFPIRFHRIKHFSLDNTIKKGNIIISNLEKTKNDTYYLCKKGDKTARAVQKVLNQK